MASQVCIFEDDQYERLFPLVYFRPVYNLRCGISSLKEKIIRLCPGTEVSYHCRRYLDPSLRVRNPRMHINEILSESCLFVNGRVVADEEFASAVCLNKNQKDVVYTSGSTVVAAYVSGSNLQRIKRDIPDTFSVSSFENLASREVKARIVSYPWDLVHMNGDQLVSDFEFLAKSSGNRNRSRGSKSYSRSYPGSYFLNAKQILISDSATIKPGVVLDAEKGPIHIGRNVTILPLTSIVGPVSIGDGSIVKAGSTIYENTSIGPVCKIGGEVEGSIVHGYSNKQHSGFLGHAYIGAWVNLGAGTNNSDLKNNYGKVKVRLGSQEIDTGLQFVGLTMGDHSKSAINSQFNTGTVVGVHSNIFGSGFPPKYIPSFTWGGSSETMTTYDINKAIDVARRVMARRKLELVPQEEALYRAIFDLTDKDRRRQGKTA
jgi:UDP-N-acetylglucosamine diphosphorylase/glucosamine-1-phosphate N-acetyltransferase